jgi:hypothetical protein
MYRVRKKKFNLYLTSQNYNYKTKMSNSNLIESQAQRKEKSSYLTSQNYNYRIKMSNS